MSKKAIIIPFMPVIFLVIISTICYHYYDDNKKPIQVNLKKPLIIFSTSSESAHMNVAFKDMLVFKEEPVATASTNIRVKYNNLVDPYQFEIVMKNLNSYQKTSGVDGIENKEYTYEILCNGQTVSAEKEIESFTGNSEIILLNEKLTFEKGDNEYKIIFRFYVNNLDQTHLAGHFFANEIYAREVKV